jgi:hypothetical protein
MRPLAIILTCSLSLAFDSGWAQTLREYAQAVDWGQRSALLDVGMTEQQVMQTVGYRPDKVEMRTCGQDSRGGVLQKVHVWQRILQFINLLSAGGQWGLGSQRLGRVSVSN